MNKTDKIYISGHNGMVGSAIMRKLKEEGYTNLIFKTSKELDLRNQKEVNDFFFKENPNYVFLCAAKVGGILANNNYRAEFLYDNLMIESNIIHASYLNNVEKLLFMGSSCVYPKNSKQPIREEYLLTDSLEYTNEPYAIAKIAGIKLCENYRKQYGCNYISVMPTNLYGPNDNYDLKNSHVLPALLRKFITSKNNGTDEVEIWGTGKPMREFLHVDDLAEATIFLMETYNDDICLNIGTGKDISIYDLAYLIRDITQYEGDITFNHNKPDGTPRKLLDVSKINRLGWTSRINLRDGITSVYELLNFK